MPERTYWTQSDRVCLSVQVGAFNMIIIIIIIIIIISSSSSSSSSSCRDPRDLFTRRFAETTNPHKVCAEKSQNPGSQNSLYTSLLRFWISKSLTHAYLKFKGWDSQARKEVPGKFETRNLSRENLSREIGRTSGCFSQAYLTIISTTCVSEFHLKPTNNYMF